MCLLPEAKVLRGKTWYVQLVLKKSEVMWGEVLERSLSNYVPWSQKEFL